MGGTGTAWLEQRICGVICECRGRVDARHGAMTILHMIGCGRGWEYLVAWLLAVIVSSLGKHSEEVSSAGLSGSLSAKGTNGLLFCVTR
jgi:hypothetical protein